MVLIMFGLGKTAGQKEADRLSNEAKQLQEFKDKYNLHSLDSAELQTIKNIADDLRANGLFKLGMALSFAKGEEQAKVGYLSALVEQNWLIINQLSRINKTLEKLEK